MSTDTVDDLQFAEDTAGCLAQALAELVAAVTVGSDAVRLLDTHRAARARLDEWRDYCRPTCGNLDGYGCTDDTCGCLCHNQ